MVVRNVSVTVAAGDGSGSESGGGSDGDAAADDSDGESGASGPGTGNSGQDDSGQDNSSQDNSSQDDTGDPVMSASDTESEAEPASTSRSDTEPDPAGVPADKATAGVATGAPVAVGSAAAKNAQGSAPSVGRGTVGAPGTVAPAVIGAIAPGPAGAVVAAVGDRLGSGHSAGAGTREVAVEGASAAARDLSIAPGLSAPVARVTRAATQNVFTRIALALVGLAPTSSAGSSGPPALPSTALVIAQWALFRRSENSLFNQSPVARPGQTGQDTTGQVSGSLNATDPDGDGLTYTVTEQPAHGTVTVNPDGSYTYIPDPDFARTGGTDSFTVTIRDNDPTAPGLGRYTDLVRQALVTAHPVLAQRLFGAHTTTVTVPVTVVGTDAPTVGTVNPATGVVTGSVPIPDPAGGPYTYRVTTQPTRGRVTVDQHGNFVYVPSARSQDEAARTPGPDTDTFTVTITRAGAPAARQGAFTLVADEGDTQVVTLTVPVAPSTPSATPTVVTGVDLGSGSVRVSPDGRRAFVNHYVDQTMTMIDTTDNSTVLIPVGPEPNDAVFSPDGRRAYVLNRGDGTVTVIDTTDGSVKDTVALGSIPYELQVTPDGSRVYAIGDDGPLTIIHTADDTVSVLAVDHDASLLRFSPDGRRAYVTNSVNRTVTVVDVATDTVVATIPVEAVGDLYFSPDGRRAYMIVTDIDHDTVTVIDTVENTAGPPLTVGRRATDVQFSPDGRRAYVPGYGDGTVTVIDTETDEVVATIPVASSPDDVLISDVRFSPDGSRAYVTSYYDGTVTVISTADDTVLTVIPVGRTNGDLWFSPDGTRLYVTSIDDGTVTVIDTTTDTALGTITLGTSPSDPQFTADGTRAYVANGDNTVTVIDTEANEIVATIPIASSPGTGISDVFLSPDGRRAYVTNLNDGTVTVIDTADNTVVTTVSSRFPEHVQFSPDGRYAYVTDYYGGGTAFISTADDAVTKVPASGVRDVQFTPDGRYAYISTNEEVIVVSLAPDEAAAGSVDLRAA